MGTAVQPNQRVEKRHGKLTIFTSYFSGAGKSYRMLETAKRVKRAGVDVAVGVVSCDQWPQTKALAEGLRGFPAKPSHAADKPSMSLTWMYA